MFNRTAEQAREALAAFNSFDGILVRVDGAIADAFRSGRAMCVVSVDNADHETLVSVQQTLRKAGYHTKSTSMTHVTHHEKNLVVAWGEAVKERAA